MANAIKMKEHIEPILKSLERYYEFQPENEKLDDDESGYSVYYQKGEDEPIHLAKPSLALFHGDLNLYNQESERIRLQLFSELLNLDKFPRNQQNYDELLKVQRANKITPFIGAGASISAGCGSWSSYLELKAKEVKISDEIINSYLVENKYEDLLELITEQPEGEAFEFYFSQDFEHANPEASYAWILPDLFNGCVITTNFDRVIEDCYSQQGKPFVEKTVGLNNPHTFIKAITKGSKYLLKLHGNIDNPEHRVFTKTEYQRAYSQTGDLLVDMESPLPELLTHLYRSHSFLFLGCSLEIDRTIATFKQFLAVEGRNKIADHYAIIEQPNDEDKFMELNNRLMMCNIKPIWYENGEHSKVTDILNLMLI